MLKALTHYNDFHKDFSKKLLGKLLSLYKTVEKFVAVVKKVLVCMDNNQFFCSFSCSKEEIKLLGCSVRGP